MEGLNLQLQVEGKDDFFMEIADQFRTEGYIEGLVKGLIEGIELGIELRFGDSGRSMYPDVENIHDVKKLQIIKEAIKRVNTCNELFDILKQL